MSIPRRHPLRSCPYPPILLAAAERHTIQYSKSRRAVSYMSVERSICLPNQQYHRRKISRALQLPFWRTKYMSCNAPRAISHKIYKRKILQEPKAEVRTCIRPLFLLALSSMLVCAHRELRAWFQQRHPNHCSQNRVGISCLERHHTFPDPSYQQWYLCVLRPREDGNPHL